MQLGAVAAAALLGATGTSSAATLNYTVTSVTGVSITISDPVAAQGLAGQIHLSTTNGIIDAWCVDAYDALADSGTVFTAPFAAGLEGVPVSLTHIQLGEIGALVAGGNSLIAAAPDLTTASIEGAAIQIAIWTVEYGPAFQYTPIGAPIDSAPDSLVQQYIAAVGPGNPWGMVFGLTALSGAQGLANQTLVTISIPEASTWAMMAIGFSGLAFAAYRTAKPKPSAA